jgi:hypothetical protein
MKDFKECRPHAVAAYVESGGSISTATITFLKLCRNLNLKAPCAPTSFVQYWGQQWQEYHSTEGHAGKSGRPRLLSLKDAKACLDQLLKWREAGLKGPYRSMHDLVKNSHAVRGIVSMTGASKRTLLRAMQEICPTLQFKKLKVKAKLTERHKQERVAVCTKHLGVPDNTLETVVWIDAKTMYMNITHRYGWVDASKEDVFETKRTSSRKANIIKLKYYIAVNARLGAVALHFYTGTTGMPAQRDGATYLVSSTNIQLRGPVSISILHSFEKYLLPTVLLALVSSKCEPHHTKTCMPCC